LYVDGEEFDVYNTIKDAEKAAKQFSELVGKK